MLPVDHVVAAELKVGVDTKVVDQVPGGLMGLDIGPKTIDAYDASHQRREDHHLERPDGRVRDASLQSRHGGAGARPWPRRVR